MARLNACGVQADALPRRGLTLRVQADAVPTAGRSARRAERQPLRCACAGPNPVPRGSLSLRLNSSARAPRGYRAASDITKSVYPTPRRRWLSGQASLALDKPRWTRPPPGACSERDLGDCRFQRRRWRCLRSVDDGVAFGATAGSRLWVVGRCWKSGFESVARH